MLPSRFISSQMSLNNNCLKIGQLSFSLEAIENIYIIGAGKASAKMGAEVEMILGNLITEGCIVVKYGYSCKLKYINVSEAGHPVPDTNGFDATREILRIAEGTNWNDLVNACCLAEFEPFYSMCPMNVLQKT